jgi:anti-anti-sigma factor
MDSFGFRVVQPHRILDGISSDRLRQEIGEVLASGVKTVLIDLIDVEFMDSSGLSSLVSALNMTRSAGAKLYLCSINEQVQMVLELTRMNRVFETFAHRDDFVKAFS